MGYLIYRFARRRLPVNAKRNFGPLPLLLVVTLLLSILPDVDAIVGFVTHDMARFHNNGTHSLIVGLVLALLIAGFVWWRYRSGFSYWLVVLFTSYAMHVVMDALTLDGRGVMLFWPISTVRYIPPVKIFYGVQWSDGLFSLAHIWTLVSETAFVLLLVLVLHFVDRKVIEQNQRQDELNL